MKTTTPIRRAAHLFGLSDDSEKVRALIKQRQGRGFKVEELIEFGAKFGYFKRPARPLCISVFVTKGGVLKTSLTLNLARLAALHGLKVCVVGLDMQADITTALLPETSN
jgi:chromosome partitioning protein